MYHDHATLNTKSYKMSFETFLIKEDVFNGMSLSWLVLHLIGLWALMIVELRKIDQE